MATEQAAFNPLSYHDGTVWPHDNGLIAAGLARYRRREEAVESPSACSRLPPTSIIGCPRYSRAIPFTH